MCLRVSWDPPDQHDQGASDDPRGAELASHALPETPTLLKQVTQLRFRSAVQRDSCAAMDKWSWEAAVLSRVSRQAHSTFQMSVQGSVASANQRATGWHTFRREEAGAPHDVTGLQPHTHRRWAGRPWLQMLVSLLHVPVCMRRPMRLEGNLGPCGDSPQVPRSLGSESHRGHGNYGKLPCGHVTPPTLR